MIGLFIFILGLAIGSFLNVCIYRIPRRESIILTPSACPLCGRRLGSRDLIPVLSFLSLKGRCRFCQAPVSPRYLIVEISTGFLFLAVYWLAGPVPQLANYLLLVAILIAVSFIDLSHCLISNKVLAAGAVLQLILNFFTRQISFIDAGLGFLAGGSLLLVVAIVSQGGMGGGDIKFASVLGLFLGWQNVILTFFVASLMGTIVGLTLIAVQRKKIKDPLPFGPFLAAAALAALGLGNQGVDWYFGLFY